MARVHPVTLALCVLVALASPPALADASRYRLDAELSHDDNASRGLYSADRKADNILAAESSVSSSILLGPRSGAVLSAGARYSRFSRFKDLSNLALSGRATYRYQAGMEFSSPWLEFAGNLAWLKHDDSDLRDGTIASLDASIGSHLTDRVRVAGGFGMDKRDGGGTAGLYDLSNKRLWVTLDYRVGLRSAIYARLTRRTGDHVFNSITVSGLSPVWAADQALADGLGRFADSYRLEATTLLYDLGFNHPLSGDSALDFSLSGFSSRSDVGSLRYDGKQLRAAYLYRFQ